jgi:hypothetical protein
VGVYDGTTYRMSPAKNRQQLNRKTLEKTERHQMGLKQKNRLTRAYSTAVADRSRETYPFLYRKNKQYLINFMTLKK